MKKDAYQSFGSYLSLLRVEDRRKYYLVSIIQATLGIFDLIGVTLLGAMGALALRGINSQPPSPLISKLLEIAHLDQKSLQFQVSVLAIIATSKYCFSWAAPQPILLQLSFLDIFHNLFLVFTPTIPRKFNIQLMQAYLQ